MSELEPLGDRALRFRLPAGVSRPALQAALDATEGVEDVVLAEELGAVILARGLALDEGRALVRRELSRAATETAPTTRASHVIRVAYDGEDLGVIAEGLGLAPSAVVRAHVEREYTVAMLGFMPGFAYLRGLDPRLAIPRRATPRPRVPAGSVAIAAGYTGIYPFASPGGWSLLGTALDFSAFDARGAALALGDRVRFEPAERGATAPAPRRPTAPRAASRPHLAVASAAGPALVVDAGRPGRMHEGLPAGGPLVPEGLARANAAIGNAEGACGLELLGPLVIVARGGAIDIGDDVLGALTLGDGETVTLAPEPGTRARYVALAGGIDVPVVLGGRGTLLVARLGGLEGRLLRRGDCLVPLAAAGAHASLPPPPDDRLTAPIPIIPGPDRGDAVLLESLLAATFTISAVSDRTGTRLEGPPLEGAASLHAAHERPSAPMVRGAIELTPGGLIVLGPDHPTTGGYPVVAVVRHDALGALFARAAGKNVRFFVP